MNTHLNECIVIILQASANCVLVSSTLTKRNYFKRWIKLYHNCEGLFNKHLKQTLEPDMLTFLYFLPYATNIFAIEFIGYCLSGTVSISRILRMFTKLIGQYLPIIYSNILYKGLIIMNKYSFNLNNDYQTVSYTQVNVVALKKIYMNFYNMSIGFNAFF